MKVHEYQGKEILAKFGVNVAQGKVAFSVDEAAANARELGGEVWAVKCQIHAGGRGKGKLYAPGTVPASAGDPDTPLGHGVVICKGLDAVEAAASSMLGNILVTHQNKVAGGGLVERILVEKGCRIARELYVGLVLDRAAERVCVMASTEGGMEIEKVAAETPELIYKEWIDPVTGFCPFQAQNLCYKLGLEPSQVRSGVKFLSGLVNAFMAYDCSLAEINPLVVTEDGDLMALDAKINFDDNAAFRHKDLAELRDLAEEDPAEIEASKWDLNYVALDGDIGCMVNGAGLAMATMDIIKLQGGEPANFLDVGGGVNVESVTAAFKIILSDPNVKCVMVNIFGGIVRCDWIADGVLTAIKDVGIEVPLVVRLQGTKAPEARAMIAESGLPVITAEHMKEAAEKAIAAAKGV